ncbi:hypothetical protein HDC93_000341 [Streptomyces sp. AK010]|nr:hypothetical protein [Streptomyces sp. AK010]
MAEAGLEALLAQGLGVAADQITAHVQLAVRGVPQGDPSWWRLVSTAYRAPARAKSLAQSRGSNGLP